MLENIIVGISTGIISSIMVTFYFRWKDRSWELGRAIYELYLYLNIVNAELSKIQAKQPHELVQVLTNEPVPISVKMKTNLPDEVKEAYKILFDLRQAASSKGLSFNEALHFYVMIKKTQLQLLVARQRIEKKHGLLRKKF